MKNIKKHTHEDRTKVIAEMVPMIKKKFGDNLAAFAVCCSYARNEDTHYSDLELIAFVRTMPEGVPRGGLARLYDGMLIELEWMTRETYLKTVRDVNEQWYLSGSDRLVAIINEEFIAELNAYRPPDLKQKCLNQAAGVFAEYQEAVSKVLNAVEQDNHEGMPVLFFEMIMQILRLLSFLNQEPYVTASRMILQAGNFRIKPESMTGMLDMAVDGNYQDFVVLENITTTVFGEFESIFETLGLTLCDDNFDPNESVHPMRRIKPD